MALGPGSCVKALADGCGSSGIDRGERSGSAGRPRAGVRRGADEANTNASMRVITPSEVSGIGSPKTIGPAAIVNRFAATLVTAMTGTALPRLEAPPGHRGPWDRGERYDSRQRVEEHCGGAVAQMVREGLDRSVGGRPERSGGCSEDHALVDPAAACAGQEGGDGEPAHPGPQPGGVVGGYALSPVPPIVAERNARPSAASPTPIHSRRVTSWSKSPCAVTVRSTRPRRSPIGPGRWARVRALRRAAPGAHRDRDPEHVPAGAKQGERRPTGRRNSTAGDSTAPRCL